MEMGYVTRIAARRRRRCALTAKVVMVMACTAAGFTAGAIYVLKATAGTAGFLDK